MSTLLSSLDSEAVLGFVCAGALLIGAAAAVISLFFPHKDGKPFERTQFHSDPIIPTDEWACNEMFAPQFDPKHKHERWRDPEGIY